MTAVEEEEQEKKESVLVIVSCHPDTANIKLEEVVFCEGELVQASVLTLAPSYLYPASARWVCPPSPDTPGTPQSSWVTIPAGGRGPGY